MNNSLAPVRSECGSKNVIFNLVLILIGIFRSSYDNALWWIPQDLTDDKSTLVQVMATSHYLSQCWLSFLSPYGVTRPQWVKNKFRSSPCRLFPLLLSTSCCLGTVAFNNYDNQPNAIKEQPMCGCMIGQPGPSGLPGVPGHNGQRGQDGYKGEKGSKGSQGQDGQSGG